jgi:formylglycine-generating enzyme required for sulfatase activity
MVWAKGTTLQNGKYRIEGELGQGGFGITYRATLVQSGGKVVIKAPRNDLMARDKEYPKYVKQFGKEVRSLEQLPSDDEHLIKIRDIFDEPQLYYGGPEPREILIPCLVMNFIEGETLFELINREGVIGEEQAIDWISTVATTLVKVHAVGLVHRDIHSANIMIKPDGQPVIIDFGIAHEIQPMSKTTVCAGGHQTFAPFEQLHPRAKTNRSDPRIDIYTLAATLYFAITGKAPESPEAIHFNKLKLTAPKSIKPEITVSTNRAIMSGMGFYPDDRPSTMQEWLDILMGDRRPKRFTRRKVLQYGGLAAGGFGLALVGDRVYKAFMPEPIFLPGPKPPQLSELKLIKKSFKTVLLNEVGTIESQPEKSARYYQEDLGNGVVLTMVLVTGGTFQMGSPEREDRRYTSESPLHNVNVPDFLMGEVQVTQAQWKAVATQLPEVRLKLNPTPSFYRQDGNDRPVERVSWFEALEFCDRLAKKTGKPYRLPSEAEWEYACRAGTRSPFNFGPTMTTDVANYRGTDDVQGNAPILGNYGKGPKGEYRGETTAVKRFLANGIGLYDMHGNVWEWCQDNWHENYKSAPIDSSPWFISNADLNSDRIIRGGSWLSSPQYCRSANRYLSAPGTRNHDISIRIVLSLQ